jgi:hypothetical protein
MNSYTIQYEESQGIKDETLENLKFNGMVGLIQNDVN